MSSRQDPNRKRFPSLWLLTLVVPLGAGLGWWLGQAPPPPVPEAAPVASAPAPPPAAPRSVRPTDSAAEPVISDWMTYEAAMAESRRTGKPILLDFNAAWCGPCRLLRRQVFEDPGFSVDVRRAVIPVSVVDRLREDGRNSDETESLQQRWRIDAFPTLVVYSPLTGRSEETRGFRGADWTTRWVESSARAVR